MQIEDEAGPWAHAFISVHGWRALGILDYGWIGQLKPKWAGFR